MSDALIADKFSLPSSWGIEILNNLTELIIDGTHFTPNYVEAGVPFLRVTDIQDKSINFDNLKFISPEEHKLLSKRCNPVRGDILYSKNGTIGIPKIVDWDWEFSVFVSLCLIKLSKSKLNPEYLKFILQSDIIKWQIHRRAKQGTVTNLHLEEIRELELPALKLPHQRKIARILTTVDNIIEKTEAAIAKYKAIKQGMMHDLFTRGIDVKTGKLRPKFEDAPELYKESELGWIPKEWEVKRLDEIGCIISGGTPSSNIPDYWNGSIIWVTPADLSKLKFGYIADSERKITSFGLKNSSALLIPQRSIVLSSRAPIGYCAIVEKDFTTNQGCKSLALFEGNSAEFFYYNIVNHVSRIKLKGEGTTFAEISKKALEKIPFVWCKPKEQTEIAKRLISIDNHTQNEESFLAKYQKIKSGLMQDLLTGKKEVTPDPEDYKEMEN